MPKDGGELEKEGGDGVKKARIAGGFVGIMLGAVALLLLVVIILLTHGFRLPG